jgi:hypothetical protein
MSEKECLMKLLENSREKLSKSERKRYLAGILPYHMGPFQEETWCRTLATVSALALLLWPQPFFAGPHGDLCP